VQATLTGVDLAAQTVFGRTEGGAAITEGYDALIISTGGIQPNGLEVFLPTGHAFRFPSWSVERVVMPWIVRWGMYRGVRQNDPLG
jgi:hypothetical protein